MVNTIQFRMLLTGENVIIISFDSDILAEKAFSHISPYINPQGGFSSKYLQAKEIRLVADHAIRWVELSDIRKQVSKLLKNI